MDTNGASDLLSEEDIAILEEYRECSSVSGWLFILGFLLTAMFSALICLSIFGWGKQIAAFQWFVNHFPPFVVAMVILGASGLVARYVAKRILQEHLARRRVRMILLRDNPRLLAVARKVYAHAADLRADEDLYDSAYSVLGDRYFQRLFA